MYNSILDVEYYDVNSIPGRFTEIIKTTEFVGTKKRKYLNNAQVYDSEATSFINNDIKVALPYQWGFAIQDPAINKPILIVGRKIEEWLTLCEIMNLIITLRSDLEKGCSYYIPIYIHNLSYDYTFLVKPMSTIPPEVFYAKKNSPIYARFNNYHIELRCSLMLSGKKLLDLDTKVKKLDGEKFDYNKMRHFDTPLTEYEWAYALNDIRVLVEYVDSMIKRENGVHNIPYTKTGFVRRLLNEKCMGKGYVSDKKKNYINSIKDMQFQSVDEYLVLKNAYTGGHTAANPIYVGKKLGKCRCYDFTSSYPAEIRFKFPRKFIDHYEKPTEEQIRELIDNGYAFWGCFRFKNIIAKDVWSTSIASSKCFEINYNNDEVATNNGKIYQADSLTIYLTSVAFDITDMNYEWDDVEIEDVYVYECGYLPIDVIMTILQLYADKTLLKHKEECEIEYNYLKELLNAVYGCMVFDRCKGNIECDEWGNCTDELENICKQPKKENETEEEYNKRIEEDYLNNLFDKVCKYNTDLMDGKIATPYAWGVFISDYSRRNLWKGIRKAGELGMFVYCDTDSIYFLENEYTKEFDEWVREFNKGVEEEFDEMCEILKIDKSLWKAKDKDNIEIPLGFWDDDGHYDNMKTLRAKSYICENKKGFKITIAGLNKIKGAKYMKDKWGNTVWEHFNTKMKIPADKTGKATHTVIRMRCEGELTDYLGNTVEYKVDGGTHLEPCEFTMSYAKEFLRFLKGFRNDLTEV